MDRREFMKGAALGVGAGVLGSMGLYSYSPLRRAFLPEVKRGTADIGVCKSVKVTNISETSWFDNGIFMNDVTAGRCWRVLHIVPVPAAGDGRRAFPSLRGQWITGL